MSSANDREKLAIRHVRLGWASVAVFMLFGLALEGFHAIKADWYLEQASETRRLMFTLAHAHGSLLGLLNIAFGLTVGRGLSGRSPEMASRLLAAGTVLLPAGFFLGGLYLYGGDPGLGAALAPVGALAVLAAAALAALDANGHMIVPTASEPGGAAGPTSPKKRSRRH